MEFLRNLFGSKKSEEIVVIKNETDFIKAYYQGQYIVPEHIVIEQENPNLNEIYNKGRGYRHGR